MALKRRKAGRSVHDEIAGGVQGRLLSLVGQAEGRCYAGSVLKAKTTCWCLQGAARANPGRRRCWLRRDVLKAAVDTARVARTRVSDIEKQRRYAQVR